MHLYELLLRIGPQSVSYFLVEEDVEIARQSLDVGAWMMTAAVFVWFGILRLQGSSGKAGIRKQVNVGF